MSSSNSINKLLFLLLFILLIKEAKAQMAWEWVNTQISSSHSNLYDLAIDADKNIYITGSFDGNTKLTGINIKAKASSDIFIAKFTANKDLVWIKQLGETGDNAGIGLVLDNSGNSYVTGPWNSYEKTFLAKYSNDGELLWLKTYDEGLYERTKPICFYKSKIAVISKNLITLFDSEGNIVAERQTMAQSLTCDDTYLYSATAGNISFHIENLASINIINFCPDNINIKSFIASDNYFYVTGFYSGEITIGDSIYNNEQAMFIAKIDTNGNVIFANHCKSDRSAGLDIALNSNNDICVAGFYNHTGIFDNTVLGQTGDFYEIFVATYNGDNGKLMYINNAGSYAYDVAHALEIDSDGNILVGGNISQINESGVAFGDLIIQSDNPSSFFGKLSTSEISATIYGNVVADSTPVHGDLEVYRLENDSSVTLVYKKLTLSDGKYKINLSHRGKYILWSYNYVNNHVSAYYLNSFWWENAIPIEITSDTIVNNVDISLIKLPELNGNNTISGALFDQNENVQRFIDLYLVTDKDSVISYVRSDTLGMYLFQQIPNGVYQIYVNKVGMLMDSVYTINTSQKSTFSDYNYIIDYANRRIKIANNQSTNIYELNENVSLYDIYPNPAIDYLNVVNSEDDFNALDYIIIDNSGKVVRVIKKDYTRKINISELKNGSYILIIKSETKSQIRKFIKI